MKNENIFKIKKKLKSSLNNLEKKAVVHCRVLAIYLKKLNLPPLLIQLDKNVILKRAVLASYSIFRYQEGKC